MKEKIEKNIDYLTQLTKEESDFIEHILMWDDEQKMSFIMAKRIFEECVNDNKSKTE